MVIGITLIILIVWFVLASGLNSDNDKTFNKANNATAGIFILINISLFVGALYLLSN